MSFQKTKMGIVLYQEQVLGNSGTRSWYYTREAFSRQSKGLFNASFGFQAMEAKESQCGPRMVFGNFSSSGTACNFGPALALIIMCLYLCF